MSNPNRLEGGRKSNRKRMYYTRTNIGKISSPREKSGESFQGLHTIEHIDRSKNIEADELAKAAARKTPLPADVFFHTIKDASVKIVEPKPRLIHVIEGED